MREVADLRTVDPVADVELADTVDHCLDRVRGRRLLEHERAATPLVHRQQVGERAADVDTNTKWTSHNCPSVPGAPPVAPTDGTFASADLSWPHTPRLHGGRHMRSVPAALAALTLVLAACQSQPTESRLDHQLRRSARRRPPPRASRPRADNPTSAPAAQAAAKPAQGGTVTIGLDQEPPTLDPEASPSAITFYITSSVGDTLLYLDENRELKPWLAEKWEVGRQQVVHVHATQGRDLPGRHALQRQCRKVERRSCRRSQLQSWRSARAIDRLSSVPTSSTTTRCASASRTRSSVPDVRGQSVPADGVADCHPEAGRSGQSDSGDPAHTRSTNGWPRTTSPCPLGRLQAPRAVVRSRSRRVPGQGHLEVHSGGRHPRRHGRVGRDADRDVFTPQDLSASRRRGCKWSARPGSAPRS